uniref:Polyketide synthase n=1 Tax=Aquilaria crassna TaxID=223751 RepID=A0A1U8XXE1_AQUCR|nr:polyketide synthase [Aquilaria crassna]
MERVEKRQPNQWRGKGVATILAIGTANPPNCYLQSDFPDFYFRATNSNHKTELKDKFRRMCEKSKIKKRYLYLTEETLRRSPNICSHEDPSLTARQDILCPEIPKLGMEAALIALKEWGRPKSLITHLIFQTTHGVEAPGADFRLLNLLSLNSNVKRVMSYTAGCNAGALTLRMAKDFSENNPRARVLLVCSELTVGTFRGPSESNVSDMVLRAIGGDGAAALIIGSDPDPSVERPLFEIAATSQGIVPGTEDCIGGRLTEVGLTSFLSKDVPTFIGEYIEKVLVELCGSGGLTGRDWNSFFWVVHTGGVAVLDQVEAKLGLVQEKLGASRHVLSQYGNMLSASVFFVLDEMRKRSSEQGKGTTGDGSEWGILYGYGPGITLDATLLRSVALN